MPLLTLDFLSCIVADRINRAPPFFCAFHALTVDNGGCGAGFTTQLFAAFHIKLMMDTPQRAIPPPQIQIGPRVKSKLKKSRGAHPVFWGGKSLGKARHWQPVDSTYMMPFTISRTTTSRLRPPRLAGRISGATRTQI